MVAALAAKTEKADSLLAQIAKNVQEGKTTTMDPALSDEVKRLLGCALPCPHREARHMLTRFDLQRRAHGRGRARQGLSRSAHKRGAPPPTHFLLKPRLTLAMWASDRSSACSRRCVDSPPECRFPSRLLTSIRLPGRQAPRREEGAADRHRRAHGGEHPVPPQGLAWIADADGSAVCCEARRRVCCRSTTPCSSRPLLAVTSG